MKKLQAVYDAIVQYNRDYGVPITRRRLGDLVDIPSTSSVEYYLRRLVAMGLIKIIDRHPVPVEIQKYLKQYTPIQGVKF